MIFLLNWFNIIFIILFKKKAWFHLPNMESVLYIINYFMWKVLLQLNYFFLIKKAADWYSVDQKVHSYM